MRTAHLVIAVALLFLSLANIARADRFTIPHPDDPTKSVEYYMLKPKTTGPWPTVLLLHGHQEAGPQVGGRVFDDWGVLGRFAQRGYLAVAVSQPGYGGSTGPADFCGPFTQRAVSAVIAKIRADGFLGDRLVLVGISRGAIAAGLVAAYDRNVSGLVLISGVYDLTQFASDLAPNETKLEVVNSLIDETGGGDAAALQWRSLLHVADKIKANTLILNGAKDDRATPDQAQRLAAAIKAHGGHARVIIYPDYGHQIPVDVRNRDVDPFIDTVLKTNAPKP